MNWTQTSTGNCLIQLEMKTPDECSDICSKATAKGLV